MRRLAMGDWLLAIGDRAIRRVGLAIVLLVSSYSYALHVECVGKATLLTQEGDTLLVLPLPSADVVFNPHLLEPAQPVDVRTEYVYNF